MFYRLNTEHVPLPPEYTDILFLQIDVVEDPLSLQRPDASEGSKMKDCYFIKGLIKQMSIHQTLRGGRTHSSGKYQALRGGRTHSSGKYQALRGGRPPCTG